MLQTCSRNDVRSVVWLFLCMWLKRVCPIRVKGKVHPITGHEGPEGEWRYSCALSLTSALGGVGG